jgi:outer membrane protein assembly factor BamA
VRYGEVFGDAVLPPQVRMFSGGVNTVRGLPENLLGPYVLVASPAAGMLCPTGGACDGESVDPELVEPRPLGGKRVVEWNAEARWWAADVLQVAAFVDVGHVQARSDLRGRTCDGGELCLDVPGMTRVTPGIGIRLITDIGPIRLDLAYDGGSGRTVPLLARGPDGDVASAGRVRFDPYGWDDPGALRGFVRRLQLQMAIGQAF